MCLWLAAFSATHVLFIFVQNLLTGFILFFCMSSLPHPFRPENENIGSSLVLVKFPPYAVASSLIPIIEAGEVHTSWLSISHSGGVFGYVPDTTQRAPEIADINRAKPFSCFYFSWFSALPILSCISKEISSTH